MCHKKTYCSEICSRLFISFPANPRRRNSGATVSAVTWPCHFSPPPSAFPMTEISAKKDFLLYREQTSMCCENNAWLQLLLTIPLRISTQLWFTYCIPWSSLQRTRMSGSIQANVPNTACKMGGHTTIVKRFYVVQSYI